MTRLRQARLVAHVTPLVLEQLRGPSRFVLGARIRYLGVREWWTKGEQDWLRALVLARLDADIAYYRRITTDERYSLRQSA